MVFFDRLLGTIVGEVAARPRRRWSTPPAIQFSLISLFFKQNDPLLDALA